MFARRAMDYWHGGAPDIAVGEIIEGPARRRGRLRQEQLAQERFLARTRYSEMRDPKRVYFTTDRELARGWAVTNRDNGSLYRVRPVPSASLELDPDFPPVGFSARRAEVLEVAEIRVEMPEDEAMRACCRYITWNDDSPTYDAEGFLLPPPEHRGRGKAAEDYRHLGKWVNIDGGLMLSPSGTIYVNPPTVG